MTKDENKNTADKNESGMDFFGTSGTLKQVFYIMLFSGVVVTGGGLYLTIIKSGVTGYTGSDDVGNPGHMQTINGPSVLIFGLLLLIFPLYKIVKEKYGQKNKS